MHNRRFEIRPIASRRLRAALLLVFALGLIGISQTRFSGVELVVAVLTLGAIFADAWRRTRLPHIQFKLNYRPLACQVVDVHGHETPLRCTHASIYPWLMVLRFESDNKHLPLGMKPTVVLMPDSLQSTDDWRRLLVWARLVRRQLANR